MSRAPRVSIGGRRAVSLRPEDVLGEGGEAVVYRVEGRAVKLFRQASAAREDKVRALLALAPRLPREAIAPEELVVDASRGPGAGRVVGFAMALLDPALEPLAVLSRKAFRAARGLRGADVAAVFARLARALRAVHAAGLVVGDLSDQNELFSAGEVALVDVDSFQAPGFPCEVATEAFLDPRLYGPDPAAPALSPGGPRRFDEASDWWAYAVLLFRSLTLLHPFGGVDPALPTLARRALARRSVLSDGVRLPTGAEARIAGLPRPALLAFERVFEGGARDLPGELADELARSLTTCGCGVDHEQGRACPACARVHVLPASAGLAHERLFEAPGPIVALASAGRTLRLVVADGPELALFTFDPGERRPRREALGRVSRRLAVALGSGACAIERDGGLATFVSFTTGARCDSAASPFAGPMPAVAAATSVHRVCGSMILRGAPTAAGLEEEPVAQALAGQTWIAAGAVRGREALAGATRVLGARQYFLVAGGHAPLAPSALEPGEALLHEAFAFGPRHVVLHRATELGAARLRRDVFDAEGRLLSSAVLPRTAPWVPNVLVGDGALLRPTDEGLLREPLEPGRASRLFAASAPFVGDDALLAPLGDHLAVAHGAAVTLLRLA